ncbi:MAG TPA: hypothetical protein VLD57_13135 [Blastocatellia bacterium]|nr:hypothetical protein [Blastocatellia bacterium]
MALYKRSILSRACVTILVLATFLSHVYSQIQTNNRSLFRLSPEHSLNGAFREMLRPQAKQLLDQVERSYGREVRVKIINNANPYLIGESLLEEDGVPEVRLNASTGCREVCIVHELFHLKLKAEGYPAIIITAGLSESQRSYFENVARVVRETIQHRAFYPEMRSMGLSPEARQVSLLRQRIKDDRNERISVAPDQVLSALDYFIACLEAEDQELISQIESFYQKKQLIWALETGKRLVSLVNQSSPQTPEEKIELVIRCLGALFPAKVSFEVRSWLKRFDIENIVVIEVLSR